MTTRPWEQFNGEAQRKQAGNAKEVSDQSTGSASGTQPVGVMPDDIKNHDTGKGMEDVVEVTGIPSYGTSMKELTVEAKRPEKKEEVTKTEQPVTSEHRTAPTILQPPVGVMPDDIKNHDNSNGMEVANAIKEEQERERMQEQQRAERQRHDSYVEETNKALNEARKGASSNVKPLNVGTITPAISGDPNETEEQKQARAEKRKLENYAQEHPWVLEKDYSTMRNKYRDKKWREIVNEVAAYREKTGNPMSNEEMYYMLSQYNPDTSKKEEVREKRLAYWADALNQLGNVLAHFYNYGRAKGGSPAAQVPDNKSSYSERLRAADMAMRQRGYNDYVNALANAQKRKQAREDMEYRLRMQEAQEQRRLANQIALKEHEWLSPKYKLELERLGKDLSNKDTQLELNKAKLAYQMMINEGKSAEQALEMSYKRLRNALANKKLNDGDGKPYKVGGQSYSDAYAAYKRGVILYNKTHPNNQKKVVNSTKFNSKPNDYLKEVGVETN